MLYNTNLNIGSVTIASEGIRLKVNLTGMNPQFILTCISTGGPATTVTWTRDSITVTEGTETVLNDPVTARYTHTLTVTERGSYTCHVSNLISSESVTRECKNLPNTFFSPFLIFNVQFQVSQALTLL